MRADRPHPTRGTVRQSPLRTLVIRTAPNGPIRVRCPPGLVLMRGNDSFGPRGSLPPTGGVRRHDPSRRSQACVVLGVVLDRLSLPSLPRSPGERVVLRAHLESDVDDRLRHPIEPEEEDGYGSSWRREWDGRRYHTREHLTRDHGALDPSVYTWAVEHDRHCIGSARPRVDPGQHCATYSVGLFVVGLRGRGLGRELTGMVLHGTPPVLRVEVTALPRREQQVIRLSACGPGLDDRTDHFRQRDETRPTALGGRPFDDRAGRMSGMLIRSSGMACRTG